MRRFLLTSLLLTATLSTYAQKRTYFLLAPPTYLMPGVKKLAVLDFSGENGPEVSAHLISQLMKEGRGIPAFVSNGAFGLGKTQKGQSWEQGGTTVIFTIIERSQLSQLIGEQSMANDGAMAKATRSLGVDVMVAGTTKGGYNMKYGTNSRTITGVVTLNLRLIDVKTGAVIHTKTIEGTASQNANNNEAIMSQSQIVEAAGENAAYLASCYLAPWYSRCEFKFVKIKAKDYKDQSKKAIDLIDDERFPEAYTVYKTVYDADNYCAEAAYNMGLILTMFGNFDKGVEMIGKAAEIDAGEYGEALKFCRTEKANADLLSSIGINLVQTEFTGDVKTVIAAAKLYTRGNKTDRHEVYDKAPGGTSIAKVPGDTPFEIISNNGDWILIKLIGGKQGISASRT